MGLRIVVVGPVAPEILRDLHALDGGSEVVMVADASALTEEVRARAPGAVAFPLSGADEESASSFFARVDAEVARATRYSHPLALVLIAHDPIDDAAGAYDGEALREWTDAIHEGLRRSLRRVDVTARLASGTIAVLLPETGEAGAEAVAERARRLAAAVIVKPTSGRRGAALPLKATCSVGVARLDRSDRGDDAQRLLGRAREALEAERSRKGGPPGSARVLP